MWFLCCWRIRCELVVLECCIMARRRISRRIGSVIIRGSRRLIICKRWFWSKIWSWRIMCVMFWLVWWCWLCLIVFLIFCVLWRWLSKFLATLSWVIRALLRVCLKRMVWRVCLVVDCLCVLLWMCCKLWCFLWCGRLLRKSLIRRLKLRTSRRRRRVKRRFLSSRKSSVLGYFCLVLCK